MLARILARITDGPPGAIGPESPCSRLRAHGHRGRSRLPWWQSERESGAPAARCRCGAGRGARCGRAQAPARRAGPVACAVCRVAARWCPAVPGCGCARPPAVPGRVCRAGCAGCRPACTRRSHRGRAGLREGGAGERRDKPAWRRDMKTSCIEGVATHDDLKSCVGAREDAGEALTEGDVGWVIEPRNQQFRVPTPSQWPEGNIAGRAIASCQRAPRGQRACACVESSGARTGRSRGCPSGCDGRAGRSGNAEAVSPR